MTLSNISSDIRSEVLEHTDSKGNIYLLERFERTIPVEKLEHHRDNKTLCEACNRYGKNLACPPYSPYFSDYIKNSTAANIICYRIHMEQIQPVIGEPVYRTAHKTVKALIDKELLDYRKQRKIIAGAGRCLACKECVIERGDKICRTPSQLIYSLESLGVNLVSLTEKVLELTLEWSSTGHEADHVIAIGAVFQ